MIAYTVAVTFSNPGLAEEWLRWLVDGHIAAVLAGGATDAEIIELDSPAQAVEVRYHFPSPEVFAHYDKEHAPQLRAEGLARFPVEKVITYRRSVPLIS